MILYRQALEDTDSALFLLYGRFNGKESKRIMQWLYLVIAGVLETVWSTCMKFSEGFTDVKYTIFTVVGMIFSFVFLAQATKSLPLGTAYPVWTGIGALGAVVIGVVMFKEPVTAARIFFVSLLLIGIVGLKATSGH